MSLIWLEEHFQEVIFYNVSSPTLYNAYLTVIDDAGSLQAVLVLEKPMPVMNYALEHRASSALIVATGFVVGDPGLEGSGDLNNGGGCKMIII